MYSIVASEWPACRTCLQARLARAKNGNAKVEPIHG
jgi:hypothetical protein